MYLCQHIVQIERRCSLLTCLLYAEITGAADCVEASIEIQEYHILQVGYLVHQVLAYTAVADQLLTN